MADPAADPAAVALIALVGNYRFFSSHERTAWNNLPTRDEKWAYLLFARQRHAAEDERVANNPRRRHKYRKKSFLIMREWRALDPYAEDGSGRIDRIEAARTDVNRPDAFKFQVSPRSGSPGSINDFESLPDAGNNDTDWFRGLTFRFVRSLFKRNYRVEADSKGYWTAVRLYVGVDDSNRIRDTVVVKNVDVYETSDQENALGLALEKTVKRLAWGLPDNDHILKPRYWRLSSYEYTARDDDGNVMLTDEGEDKVQRGGLRSYWDYCEGGDLRDLIEQYSWEMAGNDGECKIPEKFIWHVFHSMALALYTLYAHEQYDSTREENKLGQFGRGNTIHRDIKPHNIFLRSGGDENFPGFSDMYPRPVLGDFDFAVLMKDLKESYPNDYAIGTKGYIAPDYYLDHQNDPVSSKSDIWSLAGVIWDLMNSKRGWPSDPKFLGNVGLANMRMTTQNRIVDTILNTRFRKPDYPTHNYMQDVLHPRDDLPKYTTWLTELVDDCSRHDPKERIGIVELLKRMEKIMDNINIERDGLSGPKDKLRLQPDPFLRGRVVNLTRRRAA
ncbi:hypothetical protein PMIN07_011375 [Paraphaeosphaeria minitans]